MTWRTFKVRLSCSCNIISHVHKIPLVRMIINSGWWLQIKKHIFITAEQVTKTFQPFATYSGQHSLFVKWPLSLLSSGTVISFGVDENKLPFHWLDFDSKLHIFTIVVNFSDVVTVLNTASPSDNSKRPRLSLNCLMIHFKGALPW